MTNAIIVRGANKHYCDFAALDNVDFEVPSGSLTVRFTRTGATVITSEANHKRLPRLREILDVLRAPSPPDDAAVDRVVTLMEQIGVREQAA